MKKTRINEISAIFSKSLLLIIKNPKLLIFSLILISISELRALVVGDGIPNYLIGCLSLFTSFISIYLTIVLTNYYIFFVYKFEEDVESDVDLFLQSRKYLWKSFLQAVIGFVFVCLFSIPVVLTGIILVRVFESLKLIVAILVFYLIGLLSLGAISVGQRMLLDRKTNVVRSAWNGLKNLSLHQSWYSSFYFAYLLMSTTIFAARGLLGSMLTGVDVFSVPIIPIFPFFQNYLQATSHLIVRVLSDLFSIFMFPFSNFLLTYAYLDRKKYENQ